MSTKILLADDHAIIRDGLRSLLESEDGYEIVGEAADGRAAVRMARDLSPDIVIMDVGMPEMNGIDAARQIVALDKGIRVVALSMHADANYVGQMLQAGATAYLLKESAFEELATAVSEVKQDHVYLSPGITGVVVGDYVQKMGSGRSAARTANLTPKEREVLQLVAEGKSTKEIAAALFVSVKTIETHRQNIMNRLNIRSIAQLTKYAIREGLTSLDY